MAPSPPDGDRRAASDVSVIHLDGSVTGSGDGGYRPGSRHGPHALTASRNVLRSIERDAPSPSTTTVEPSRADARDRACGGPLAGLVQERREVVEGQPNAPPRRRARRRRRARPPGAGRGAGRCRRPRRCRTSDRSRSRSRRCRPAGRRSSRTSPGGPPDGARTSAGRPGRTGPGSPGRPDTTSSRRSASSASRPARRPSPSSRARSCARRSPAPRAPTAATTAGPRRCPSGSPRTGASPSGRASRRPRASPRACPGSGPRAAAARTERIATRRAGRCRAPGARSPAGARMTAPIGAASGIGDADADVVGGARRRRADGTVARRRRGVEVHRRPRRSSGDRDQRGPTYAGGRVPPPGHASRSVREPGRRSPGLPIRACRGEDRGMREPAPVSVTEVPELRIELAPAAEAIERAGTAGRRAASRTWRNPTGRCARPRVDAGRPRRPPRGSDAAVRRVPRRDRPTPEGEIAGIARGEPAPHPRAPRAPVRRPTSTRSARTSRASSQRTRGKLGADPFPWYSGSRSTSRPPPGSCSAS